MTSERIKRRIAALLQMTTTRGCTEAEAMAAAAKAVELMRTYNLDAADVEMSEVSHLVKTGLRSARAGLWVTIAYCTNTSFLCRKDRPARVIFYGRAPGPEIAAYLMQVCNRAIDHEIAKFKRTSLYRQHLPLIIKRQLVADFTQGLIYRLGRKLHTLFADSISSKASEEATAYLERTCGAVKEVRPHQRRILFDSAARQGYAAGGNVALAHGMGTSTADLRLGETLKIGGGS